MDLSGRLIAGTGEYKIEELTSQDAVLKHLDKGTKVLTCTSAGTVAFPSDQAYGEWEFDVWKAEISDILIGFISDKIDTTNNTIGYWFYYRNTEALRLLRSVGSGNIQQFTTIDSYVDALVWYRIKITRTLDGEFSLYIKGNDFGIDDWTLLVTTPAGNNPIVDATNTESTYFVFDLDAGDRIANIIIRKGVLQ